MWKYDTSICAFWQMESWSLVGQGFASGAAPFSALFYMSLQSKWTVVSLSFFGFRPCVVRVAGRFYRAAHHIPGMWPAGRCRVLADPQRLGTVEQDWDERGRSRTASQRR